MIRTLAFIFVSAIASTAWSQTQLSPKQIGGGSLPNNVQDIIFSVGNGNWVGEVVLPKTGLPNATIKVIRTSLWAASVLQNNASNVPLHSLPLVAGVAQTYKFSSTNNQWELTSLTKVNVVNGDQSLQVPTTQNFASSVFLNRSKWVPLVVLPETAIDGALIFVKSEALKNSKIAPDHVLHERRMRLKTGDEYVFEYSSSMRKWTLARSPKTYLAWQSLKNGTMPTPDYPKTFLTIPNGYVGETIKLPQYGSNRDHLIITSNEVGTNRISNFGVSSSGTMNIKKGQFYEFIWDLTTSKWVRVKTAKTILKLNDLASDLLPAISTPVTEVIALEGGDLKKMVTLPDSASNGDRVIFKSMAPGVIQIYGAIASTVGPNTVDQNEEVTFVYGGSRWIRETFTVRMLLIHGAVTSASIGAEAMKSRLTEGLRITNQALSYSGTKLRLQTAGFMQHTEISTRAGHNLEMIRNNQVIQTERNRLNADAIYFEGAFSGVCGLAWVNTYPNANYMTAVGSTGCGTGIMAHEFGHNMGLPHNGSSVNSVMSTTYGPKFQFANPKILTLPLGVALGFDSTNPDEVSLINKNAAAVSNFR